MWWRRLQRALPAGAPAGAADRAEERLLSTRANSDSNTAWRPPRPAFGHPDTRAAMWPPSSLPAHALAWLQFRAPGVHANASDAGPCLIAKGQRHPSMRSLAPKGLANFAVFCGVRGVYIAGTHIFSVLGFPSRMMRTIIQGKGGWEGSVSGM